MLEKEAVESMFSYVNGISLLKYQIIPKFLEIAISTTELCLVCKQIKKSNKKGNVHIQK